MAPGKKKRVILNGEKGEAGILTLVSNPKNWITNPKNWISQVCQSLIPTEKPNWSVIPFSTPLTRLLHLIKVYQYQTVNITEDRGNQASPTDQGEDRSWAVLADGERLSSAGFSS